MSDALIERRAAARARIAAARTRLIETQMAAELIRQSLGRDSSEYEVADREWRTAAAADQSALDAFTAISRKTPVGQSESPVDNSLQ